MSPVSGSVVTASVEQRATGPSGMTSSCWMLESVTVDRVAGHDEVFKNPAGENVYVWSSVPDAAS